MKFEKRKEIDLVTGQPFWIFEARDPDMLQAFQIRSTVGGIKLQGPSPEVTNQEELSALAKAIGKAWEAHLALKPVIAKTIAGH